MRRRARRRKRAPSLTPMATFCRLRLTVSAALKRTGKEMKFVIEGADEERNAGSEPLSDLLVRANALSRRSARRAWARLKRRA